MGRKKIEIRPLVDERNRNVTFLKRKAGLMKKAWELSVLCGADVSILIFNANGKPYEFSSKELDGELERYQDYEGMIERRRADEFAAAAAAGEDSDEDDDEGDRRASTSKAGAAGGAPKPGKSLKGKETFKQRNSRSKDADRRDRDREREEARRRRRRERERKASGGERMGFIDGLLDGSQSGSDDEGRLRDRKPTSSDLAGLQYAMGMHGQNGGVQHGSYAFAQGQSSALSANGWNHRQFRPSPGATTAESHARTDISSVLGTPHSSQYPFPNMPGGTSGPGQPMSSHPPPMSSMPSTNGYTPPGYSYGGHGGASEPPSMFPPQSVNAMQQLNWDPNLLARYAEFQLQQNHQRQQRVLLEKQRHQLAQLGVPLEDKSLLDDIFGGTSGSTRGGGGEDPAQGREGSSYPNAMTSSSTSTPPFNMDPSMGQSSHSQAPADEFIWPTFRASSLPNHLHDPSREHTHAPPPPQIRDPRGGPTEEDAMWATLNGFGGHPGDAGEGDMSYHSPTSPALAYGAPKRRHTEDFALAGGDKRIRV